MGENEEIMGIEEEPVSPASRLLSAPGFNIYILVVMGLKTPIADVDGPKRALEQTLLKHPRFSSILVKNEKGHGWKRTQVNIDNHMIIPDLDPDMDGPDQFVEDYVASLSTSPMDMTKPLWELHALNVATKDASATAIFRIHHIIGDGVSLISLLLACTRKSSDPESLPTVPSKKKRAVVNIHNKKKSVVSSIWRMFLLIWIKIMIVVNTFVDLTVFLATLLFMEDTNTPIKGPVYGEKASPRRFVHRIVSLDDIKLVKNAMNVTINDVVLGVTQAGLSHYLNRRYVEQYSKNGVGSIEKIKQLPKDVRLRATVIFNTRQSTLIEDVSNLIKNESKGSWGNALGYVLLPFNIGLEQDPLTHIRQAKSTIDRKKLSLEANCTFLASQLILNLFGMKPASGLMAKVFSNTTLTFSNVPGPEEEICFSGYPIAYIAPSISGVPQAVVIHYQSYDNKFVMSLAVDEDVVHDPHQLCDDFVESLQSMKDAVLKRELVKGHLH